MGKNTWGGRALVVGTLVLGVGVGVGISDAASPGHHPSAAPSVDVAFTPLTPAKQVFSGTIGGGGTKQVVVSGGTTTVPSNATTIRMTVSGKGTKPGTLSFFPSGNPSGTSGQTVTWPAAGSGSATITTDVGQKNSVSIVNSSAATATVKVTVTGYSTEVEADDISSLGGTAGQVLTDTGAGAAWQNPQLPAAYFFRDYQYVILSGTSQTVASLTVPAGTYQVEALVTGFLGSAPTGYFVCDLFGPGNGWLGSRYGNVESTAMYNTTLGIEGLVQTNGGTINLKCVLAGGGAASVYERSILATRVGATSGPIVTKPGTSRPRVHQPGR